MMLYGIANIIVTGRMLGPKLVLLPFLIEHQILEIVTNQMQKCLFISIYFHNIKNAFKTYILFKYYPYILCCTI